MRRFGRYARKHAGGFWERQKPTEKKVEKNSEKHGFREIQKYPLNATCPQEVRWLNSGLVKGGRLHLGGYNFRLHDCHK